MKRTSTRATRLTVAIALVAVVLVGSMTSASAHTVYAEDWTLYTSADCVRTYSGVDGANAGGHYQGTTHIHKFDPVTNTNCGSDFTRPAGYIWMFLQTWFYGGSPVQWRVCAATSSIYNTSSAHSMNVELGPDEHPPCGPAYYQLLTWAMESNGSWQPSNGGPEGSGQHWLQ